MTGKNAFFRSSTRSTSQVHAGTMDVHNTQQHTSVVVFVLCACPCSVLFKETKREKSAKSVSPEIRASPRISMHHSDTVILIAYSSGGVPAALLVQKINSLGNAFFRLSPFLHNEQHDRAVIAVVDTLKVKHACV